MSLLKKISVEDEEVKKENDRIKDLCMETTYPWHKRRRAEDAFAYWDAHGPPQDVAPGSYPSIRRCTLLTGRRCDGGQTCLKCMIPIVHAIEPKLYLESMELTEFLEVESKEKIKKAEAEYAKVDS